MSLILFAACSGDGGTTPCTGDACGPMPVCSLDADCGPKMACQNGACVVAGAPLGGACSDDSDCASNLCLAESCQQACKRDGDCADGQSCSLLAFGPSGTLPPITDYRPVCMPRRQTAVPGAPCQRDADCDRGSCQLDTCVELCEASVDCVDTQMSCATLIALTDDGTQQPFSGCLPTRGTIDFAIKDGNLPIPSTAQAMAIDVQTPDFDFANIVGVVKLVDPTGQIIYTQPGGSVGFYDLPIRYAPARATSTMRVPNNPAFTLMSGVYHASISSSEPATLISRGYLKLAPAPIASGSVTLDIYLTDLTGACMEFTLADAPTKLAPAISRMRTVFEQVGVTISEVAWHSTTASSTVRIMQGSGAPLPDLNDVLRQATTGQANRHGLSLVLIRGFYDENDNPIHILGVAGSIPGSPVAGTSHSGATLSMRAPCVYGIDAAGGIAAHELGHTLGLFHNDESTGEHDQLTDNDSDGTQNLMYWEEKGGRHLSSQQGQVIRNDPKVQP